MILADTSVWIDHLRHGDKELTGLLETGAVCMHPFIISEILLGSISNRNTIQKMLGEMPQVTTARDREVLFFINTHKVYGRGIGWIDTHLLVSAKLSGGRVGTRDKRLVAGAGELGVG
jgi:predicted nucleic acid-binding protein